MTGRDAKQDKPAAAKSRSATADADERFHARVRDQRAEIDDEDEIDDAREPDDVDDDDTPAIQPAQPLIDRRQRARNTQRSS